MLTAGVRALPLPQDLIETVGSTGLFVEKVQWAVQPEGGASEPAQTDLWSGNLHQDHIFGVVDLHVSLAVTPTARLQELIVGAHVPWEEIAVVARNANTGIWTGLVNLPDDPAAGLRGGPRPSLRAQIAMPIASGWDGIGGTEFAVHYNDPELVRAFPEVRDSWGLQLALVAGYLGPMRED